MKTAHQTRARDAQVPQRTFTWAVRSTDIPFMAPERQKLGADGCACVGTDCGCSISKIDAVRARATRSERP